MKIGLIGPPASGKTTLFGLLTQSGTDTAQPARRGQTNIASVRVPDARLDFLFDLMNPRRKVQAEITFVDAQTVQRQEGRPSDDDYLRYVGDADGFCIVIGAFLTPADDAAAAQALETVLFDLICADLAKVERRIERINQEVGKGRKDAAEALPLMQRCRQQLAAERPLAALELLPTDQAALRGFQFLTQKPAMVVANITEDQLGAGVPALARAAEQHGMICLEVCGQLELEIAGLDPGEQTVFLQEYGIERPARERFIRSAYEMLDAVTFYTCNEQECRAWTVPRGTPAVKAAGRVHSDMERGFIRAEVVSIRDLQDAGSLAGCRAAGTLRLEGRDYAVQDGDLILFRFSV